WKRLRAFRLAPFPVWTFDANGISIEKRLFLVAGSDACAVVYRSSAPVVLRILPFVAFRDPDGLGAAAEISAAGERPVTVTAPGWPALALHHGGRFAAELDVYRAFEHLVDLDRGLPFREDLVKIGALDLEIGPERPGWIVASLDGRVWDEAAVVAAETAEIERRLLGAEDGLLPPLHP